MLPANPIYSLSIFTGSVDSLNDVLNLVQQYSEYTGYHKPSAGIVQNCVLATFKQVGEESGNNIPHRELLILPVNLTTPEKTEHTVSEIMADIKTIAANLGKLEQLNRLCQPYFPQIDPAEAEIQERIETIFNRIRQDEPVDLETLKSWLSVIMVRFSTLSVMSGSIRRDQVTAETYIEENKNLLNRWSESVLEGYPTNTVIEATEYASLLKPFRDFVTRTEALGTQLETVSDMVRTYLGIGQQERSSEILKQQVNMLHTIENHEDLLKRLTWVVVLLTVTLVTLEILGALHILG